MARTVEDLALLDAVITGEPMISEPAALRGVRIGIPQAHYYEGLDPEVERVSTEALVKLGDAGAVLVEMDAPGLTERNDGMIVRIAYYEFGRAMPEYLARFQRHREVHWDPKVAQFLCLRRTNKGGDTR